MAGTAGATAGNPAVSRSIACKHSIAIFRDALTVAIAATLAACAAPGAASPGVPAELAHSWEVNFKSGDAAAVVALYAPDAQLVMSGSDPAKGTAAIRASVESMIKSGVKVHVEATEKVGAGDIAYVYGT